MIFDLSVQSIIAATDTRRSSCSRDESSEMPTFTGFSESVVAAGFVGIAGRLSFAEGT